MSDHVSPDDSTDEPTRKGVVVVRAEKPTRITLKGFCCITRVKGDFVLSKPRSLSGFYEPIELRDDGICQSRDFIITSVGNECRVHIIELSIVPFMEKVCQLKAAQMAAEEDRRMA